MTNRNDAATITVTPEIRREFRNILLLNWIISGVLWLLTLNPFGIWDGPASLGIINSVGWSATLATGMALFITILMWPEPWKPSKLANKD